MSQGWNGLRVQNEGILWNMCIHCCLVWIQYLFKINTAGDKTTANIANSVKVLKFLHQPEVNNNHQPKIVLYIFTTPSSKTLLSAANHPQSSSLWEQSISSENISKDSTDLMARRPSHWHSPSSRCSIILSSFEHLPQVTKKQRRVAFVVGKGVGKIKWAHNPWSDENKGGYIKKWSICFVLAVFFDYVFYPFWKLKFWSIFIPKSCMILMILYNLTWTESPMWDEPASQQYIYQYKIQYIVPNTFNNKESIAHKDSLHNRLNMFHHLPWLFGLFSNHFTTWFETFST